MPDISALFDIKPILVQDVINSSSHDIISLREKSGVYCLYNHLGDPIYVGETDSLSQNFNKRLIRHCSGSVFDTHIFSQYYNHGLLFCMGPPNKMKKNQDLKALWLRQNIYNKERVCTLKQQLIYSNCSIAMLPIDRRDLTDNEYGKLVRKLERAAIRMGKIKGLTLDAKPFPNSLIKSILNKEDQSITEEQNTLYSEFLLLRDKYPDSNWSRKSLLA
ncbi:hypothetical protein C0Z01_00635 [Photobacterium kishitanii]|uniref:GIY-YIG nuclease family protein n=1 Tax=Photobacterium kishitanii TaxID=318456 RepID=UPI0007EF38EA|nr:GIY-YIG nuclease family protein [Photobacterium kishitanii]OBU29342.1 hypothetical protein AYY22_02170 [Photobacterium kishitanii]PSW71538.1 hypothetical protein C0Z01_00635 [Photobacterium kishitanii]